MVFERGKWKRWWRPGMQGALCFLLLAGPTCGHVLRGQALASRSAGSINARRDAAKLNNIGTALMGQQLLARALEKFDAAYQLDPSLACADLNKGIALLYLQKLPEAQEALQHAAMQTPNDPRAWYALGLLYRSESQPLPGVQAFQHVLALDPSDADSHYFLGSFQLEAHDAAGAIAEYRAALALDPLNASAQFGVARALQRSGKSDEARVAFSRFQRITSAKYGFPLSHNYGEEGRLGQVEVAPGEAPKVGPMIPVVFESVAAKATEDHAGRQGSGSKTMHGASAASAANGTAASGTGACLINLDSSGRPALVVMGHGASGASVYRGAANSGFELVPASESGLAVSGDGVACAAGDFDNDGLPDLALAMSDRVLLYRNLGGGRFEDVTTRSGVQPANHPAGVAFVDYDHDGDLDLFVTGSAAGGGSPNVLWRNNGNGTFTNWTQQAGLGGHGNTVAGQLADLNNDRAVDLLVTGSGKAPTFYANPRDGEFIASPLFADDDLPPTVGVAIFDFNKDGWMDVALTHAGAPGVTLWRNIDGKRFERVPLPLQGATRGWGVAALDVDNDGWIDLAVVVSTPTGPELRVLRNLGSTHSGSTHSGSADSRNSGSAGFEDVTAKLKLDAIKLTSPGALLAADVNVDGASDLIVAQPSGQPLVLLNRGGSRNHSLRISLRGLADNRSALGTKVEVFADGMWQKWEVTAPQDIIAGIGSADKADLVRLLWPTGVPQDEIDVAADREDAITELDRRGSSCPTLFAWNGSEFGFVSDVIGAGVVGHWIAPAKRNTPDPDEWIKIDGSRLKARNGLLSFRFGEPMEEVNFMDQVRLVAVDHPAGTSVYPNERFLSERPFAETKTVVVGSGAHAPAGAWDDHGRDVLPLLLHSDRKYVKDFTNLSYAGFANQHALTLDLGAWSAANPLRLLLSGFIEYFSASSMYAAWQAGLSPIAPYVEAQLPDGSWRRVIADMGFPAGLPRTIVVDLSGKLPVGSRRIRIVTNLQIYWDQALVDNGPESHGQESATTARQTELPLVSARLEFRGYPQQLDGATPGDLTYNYQRISRSGPFVPERGAYTRYGEVTPLLRNIDDQFVVFGTGEDMDLGFSAAAQPALPGGWVRDYFFYANGFVKDMDFYEASPFTVNAMPFHGMAAYPYPKGQHYPADAAHIAYQLEWNTRFESGDRSQRYQFDYIPALAVPDSPAVPVAPAGKAAR